MRVGDPACITDPDALLARVLAAAEMLGADLAPQVSTGEPYVVPAEGEQRFTSPRSTSASSGHARGSWPRAASTTHVLPVDRHRDDLLAVGPDAVFLSNGPGDPATADYAGRRWCRACSTPGVPLFGICFGSQILGRALGLRHLQAGLRPPRASTSRCSTGPPARSR